MEKSVSPIGTLVLKWGEGVAGDGQVHTAIFEIDNQ